MNPTLLQQVISALETAKNGLIWYQDRYPEAVDGSDDEARAEIDAALQEAACTPVPEQDMPGMSPMNRHCAYSAATTLRALGYDWLEHAGQWLPVTPEAAACVRPTAEPDEQPSLEMVKSPYGDYLTMRWAPGYEAQLGDKFYLQRRQG